MLHRVLFRSSSLVCYNGGGLDQQVGQQDEEEDQNHEGHDEERDHYRSDDGVPLLGLKARFCFWAKLGVKAHSALLTDGA